MNKYSYFLNTINKHKTQHLNQYKNVHDGSQLYVATEILQCAEFGCNDKVN